MPRPRFRTRGQKANAVAKKPALTKEEKDDRKLVVKSLAIDIHSIQKHARKHGRQTSYGVVAMELKKAQNLYPWISKSMVAWEIKKLQEFEARMVEVHLPQPLVSSSKPSGRPKGTTNAAKADLASRKRKALAEAAEQYAEAKKKGKQAHGSLKTIIKAAADKYGVDSNTSQATIRSRIFRGNLSCDSKGPESPMKGIEPVLVELCIQKAKMGQPLNQTEGLAFANSLIEGTPYQTDLINYQRKNLKMTGESVGTLGKKYWKSFKRRNKDKIDSGLPVAQDECRKQWTTYKNMEIMYDLSYASMEEAGILEKLPEPVWMDVNGRIVDNEEQALGLKVTHEMKHPDYMVFVDEVGSNTNMAHDGPIGGERLIKTKGAKAHTVASTADTHFTLLGFTAGTGEPVMCAIIFAAEQMNPEWQLGIDLQANLDISNPGIRFNKTNYGKGKWFPGGPTCYFRGKTVPAFVCCSPKGGITSELLKQMLQRMDSLDLFPRVIGGPVPTLQLDGHGSRLQLPFLRYINDDQHKWFANIGLPNGTQKWQVGDSTAQNGCYKMGLGRAKRKLVHYKTTRAIAIALRPTDIVPIVNIAWDYSFAEVESNRKAIAVRGWGPLNRALLKDKDILATREVVGGTAPHEGTTPPGGTAPHGGTTPPTVPAEDGEERSLVSALTTDTFATNGTSTSSSLGSTTTWATTATPLSTTTWATQEEVVTDLPKVTKLNWTKGLAGILITDIVQHVAKQKGVAENLEQRRVNGRKLREDMKASSNKRLTAGTLFKTNRVHLDSEVLELIEEKQREIMKKQEESVDRLTREYNTTKQAAEAVIALNLPAMSLTNSQLKSVVKYKKRKGDPALPTVKAALVERLSLTMLRSNLSLEEFLGENGQTVEDEAAEEDAIVGVI